MRKFKIRHWNGDVIDVTIIKAINQLSAQFIYLTKHYTGDIISITEVIENGN